MSPWWLLLVLVAIWVVAVLVARRRERGRHRATARQRYHGESHGRRLRDWWAWRRAGGRR